jgi:nitrate reductase NapA
LTTGRVLEHWHTGSMTRRTPQLHQAVPRAYVEINRVDAAALGIGNGSLVKVSSRRGVLKLEAKIDGRGRPPKGTVFIPFFDEGKLANVLTLDAMDCISKEPDYKKCAVRIERA